MVRLLVLVRFDIQGCKSLNRPLNDIALAKDHLGWRAEGEKDEQLARGFPFQYDHRASDKGLYFWLLNPADDNHAEQLRFTSLSSNGIASPSNAVFTARPSSVLFLTV